MNGFILIITLVLTTGTAISTAEIGGKYTCQEAGKAWLRKVDKFSRDANFICVRAFGEETEK